MGPTVTTDDLEFLSALSHFSKPITLRDFAPCEQWSRVAKLRKMGMIDCELTPHWRGYRYWITKTGRAVLRIRSRAQTQDVELYV